MAPRNMLMLAAALPVASVLAQSCAPQMFWVNYMNTPDQAHIGWTTTCNADSIVQYGSNPAALNSQATGNTTTYTFPLDSYTSPYIHHVILNGLTTSSIVYYRVGATQSGWSKVMNFTTHPGVGPTIPLRFAVIGDLGQTANSNDTLAHIAASPNPFNALLHAGDLSYADDDEERWDSWQNIVAPLAQRLPWMTVVGNHEIELDSNLKSFEAYSARFRMPDIYYKTSKQSTQLYYSWEIGSVHFIMLSSYSDYSATSDQLAWLKDDIASINRAVTPWVIAILHAPWYNSNTAHQGEGEAMREVFEQYIYNAGVDLVFAGHVHAYERCYRSYNMQRDPKGPYYITIGDGGNREGLASNWESPQPAWSAFRQASYGHGELQVVNTTHMHWTWHQNPDLEPTIADDLWIVKGQDIEGTSSVTAHPRMRRLRSN